jgi:hypothetical protein
MVFDIFIKDFFVFKSLAQSREEKAWRYQSPRPLEDIQLRPQFPLE